MEKEKILAEVKKRLGKTQFSDRTIQALIDNTSLAEGAEPDEQYFTGIVNTLKALQGQFNSDVSAQVENFKKSYKPEPTDKGGETPPDTGDKGGDKGTTPSPIDALRRELTEQKAEVEKMKQTYDEQIRKGRVDNLRNVIKNKAESLKVSNTALWNDVALSLDVKEDSTDETLLEEAKNLYEEKLKAYVGEGAALYRGETSQKRAEINPEERAKQAKADADRIRKTM